MKLIDIYVALGGNCVGCTGELDHFSFPALETRMCGLADFYKSPCLVVAGSTVVSFDVTPSDVVVTPSGGAADEDKINMMAILSSQCDLFIIWTIRNAHYIWWSTSEPLIGLKVGYNKWACKIIRILL